MKLQLLSLCFIALVAQSHVTQASFSLTPIKTVTSGITGIVGNAVNVGTGVVGTVANTTAGVLNLTVPLLTSTVGAIQNTINNLPTTLSELDLPAALTTTLTNILTPVLQFVRNAVASIANLTQSLANAITSLVAALPATLGDLLSKLSNVADPTLASIPTPNGVIAQLQTNLYSGEARLDAAVENVANELDNVVASLENKMPGIVAGGIKDAFANLNSLLTSTAPACASTITNSVNNLITNITANADSCVSDAITLIKTYAVEFAALAQQYNEEMINGTTVETLKLSDELIANLLDDLPDITFTLATGVTNLAVSSASLIVPVVLAAVECIV